MRSNLYIHGSIREGYLKNSAKGLLIMDGRVVLKYKVPSY